MKLSFVIPAYNAAAWLPHAVESCLKQTHKDTEIVIVDDCSTDSTKDYLAWLAKNYPVKIISNEINLGRSASRNKGNREAQGDAILVLDADDISTPKRAELTEAKLKQGADFIHGAAFVIDAVGKNLGDLPTEVFNRAKAIETLYTSVCHSTVGYTRKVAELIPYREDGDIPKLGIDDWAMQMELALNHPRLTMDYTPVKLSAYRVLSTAISNTRKLTDVLEAKKKFLDSLKAVA